MFFGLPWFAIVAIVAIAGGLIYAYKEEELKMEGKRLANSREMHEMRQVVHNLKSRVENLEAIVTEDSRESSKKDANPLGEIEIEDEVKEQNSDTVSQKSKSRN
ncbi:MAG: hypothetical protein HUJ22_11000 [Gracilimonas sp.]|uniref:hypothetical protein n=1 Tax=Gracilimonas sp. TaxID=1974203 RepID=UPI0019C015D9|nr:hypothetical protein [Gracilimonas sp.]MBD3617086.1 hypothetical protein [Gracilimonas sp.]